LTGQESGSRTDFDDWTRPETGGKKGNSSAVRGIDEKVLAQVLLGLRRFVQTALMVA